MAQQLINYGNPPDGSGGDNRRAALEKLEANDTELYEAVAAAQTTANVAMSAAGAASFKNKLINGNFDFWQRGTSSSAHTTQAYLADRWLSGGTGSTIAVSQQSFTYGQTAVPGQPAFFHRCVVASAAGASNNAFFGQKIENAEALAGRTITVSFWAKADAARKMAITFTQNFGVGGSASVNVNATAPITLTTAWAYYTYTVTLPSVAGATKGTGSYLAMYIYLDAGASITAAAGMGQQSGTLDYSQFQLEDASAATPFEVRPLQIELALCQRYYEKTFDLGTTPAGQGAPNYVMGVAFSSTAARFVIPFRASKRTAPTCSLFSTNVNAAFGQTLWAIFYSTGAWAACASQSVSGVNTNSISVDLIFSSGLAWGQGILGAGHWTADAEL
jgi:hypothetical protein